VAEDKDLEREQIERESKTVIDKLRDLVGDLKTIEEYEHQIKSRRSNPETDT